MMPLSEIEVSGMGFCQMGFTKIDARSIDRHGEAARIARLPEVAELTEGH